uniref:Uncharacterized protein n=1 Tax=Echeneis naucrates TaxID=173247 RepID=A0A665U177_ECHNA
DEEIKDLKSIFFCTEELYMSCRQLKQNDKSEELLKQYRYEIQEFILKHRKQRMKFENQLLQLIEQHKKLHSVFTPEKLPEEIENAEQTKWQLLSAGKYPLRIYAHSSINLHVHTVTLNFRFQEI